MANFFSTEERSNFAQQYFPEEWAAVANVCAKKAAKRRHYLRTMAENKALRDILKATNNNCGSCDFYSEGMCELHTDYYGEVKPKRSEVHSCHSKLDEYRNARPR